MTNTKLTGSQHAANPGYGWQVIRHPSFGGSSASHGLLHAWKLKPEERR
jgi:hypothetical protein